MDDEKTRLMEDNRQLRQQLTELRRGASNFNFLQVDRTHIDDLNALAENAPRAHKLLWLLCKVMNKQNAVMVSQDSLIKLTGHSRRTVQRSIDLLREQNWIEVLKIGTANVYRVNSGVFWQARADGKWASFSAELLLNWDEQDEITKVQATPSKLRNIPFVEAGDEVVVSNAGAANEDPPAQPHLDFHQS